MNVKVQHGLKVMNFRNCIEFKPESRKERWQRYFRGVMYHASRLAILTPMLAAIAWMAQYMVNGAYIAFVLGFLAFFLVYR